jgi:autotransporter-associated beta strand protein
MIQKHSSLILQRRSMAIHWRPFQSAIRVVMAIVALAMMGAAGQAAVIYWDGTSASWATVSNWSTASNATTPDPLSIPGIGDDVIFNITTANGAKVITLDASQWANSLTFNNTGTTALTGGGTSQTLTLGTGGITVNTGAGAVTIGSATAGQQVNIALTATDTWNIVTSLTANNVISGGFGINKTGAGTLVLNGVNTYSGDTTITGFLLANNNSALGSGSVTLNSGAGNELQLGNGVNIANALTINGGGATAQGAIYVPAGNATYSGTINIVGATNAGGYFATANDASKLTIAGDNTITSTQPVTVRNGYVLFAGSQSYTTGTTLANAGATIQFAKTTSMPASGTIAMSTGTTLAINVGGTNEFTTIGTGAGTLADLLAGTGGQGAPVTLAAGSQIGIDTTSLGTSGKATFDNAFLTTNNNGLVKLGVGTLELTNGGTWSGVGAAGYPLVVRQGTLQLNGSGQQYTVNGEAVVGGTYTTANGSAGYDAVLQLDASMLNVTGWLSVGRGNGIGAVSSDVIANNGAAISAANMSIGFNGGNGSNLPKSTITVNNNSSLTITGNGALNLAESSGSNGTITLNDSSTFTASGTGTKYIGLGGTGTLTMNSTGTIDFGSAAGTPTYVGYGNGVGYLNLNSGTLNVGAFRVGYGNNNTQTAKGTVVIKSGATLNAEGDVLLGFAGSASCQSHLTLDGGTLNVGTTTKRWMIVGQYDYTNNTVDVNSGNLNLNANTDIRFRTGGYGNETNVFNLNGGNVTSYSDNATTANGSGVIDLMNANNATTTNSTLNLNGGVLTIGQVMASSSVGTRTLNFNGGILKPTATTTNFIALGTGTAVANVRNSGAIIDSNGYDITIAQPLLHSNVSGDAATDGGLKKQGLGTLTLSGANAYNGATTVNSGKLSLAATGTLLNSDVTVASGATFGGAGSAKSTTIKSGGIVEGGVLGLGTLSTGDLAFGLNTDTGITGTVTATLASGYTPIAATNLTVYGGIHSILLNASGIGLSTGDYDVIGYSGILNTPNVANAVDAFYTNTRAYTPKIITGKVQLTYNVDATVIWKGSSNATTGTEWSTRTLSPKNWTIGGTATDFQTNDVVLFNNTTSYNTVDINLANVSPVSATFDNDTSHNYTLQSTGGFGIATGLLLKTGAGSLTINNANTYAGTTTLNAGTLNINNGGTATPAASAIGTGTFIINGGTINNTSGMPVTLATNNLVTVNSDFTFTGSSDLSLGTGSVTLGGTGTARTITVAASTLTMGSIPTATTGLGLTKAGAGTLYVTGATSHIDGTLNIQAGTMQIDSDMYVTGLTGPASVTLDNINTSAKWFFVNNATNSTFDGVIYSSASKIGLNKSGAGTLTLTNASNIINDAITVNAGTLDFAGSHTSSQYDAVGTTTGANGILRMASGSMFTSNAGASPWSASLDIGTAGAGCVKVVDGNYFSTGHQLTVGRNSGSYGAFTQTGGSTTVGGFLALGLDGASSVVNLSGGIFSQNGPVTGSATSGGVGVINVRGTASFTQSTTGDNGFWVGESGTCYLSVSDSATFSTGTSAGLQLGRNASGVGVVNLLGGTVTTNRVYRGAGAGTLNFNGGTLNAGADNPAFLTGLTNAYVYSGGAIINDGSSTITIGQNLLAPTGKGVTAAGLTVSGSGYIDTPLVTITGGGGSGATAVANIDAAGNLTGITITNPGVDYTSAPTFALVGGGVGNTGAISGTATLVANTSGGFTKNGYGTTNLSGTSTYTGATTVNGGSLIISGSGAINSSSGIAVNAAKLVQASSVAISPVVTLTDGTIDGTGTINTVNVTNSYYGTIANGNGTAGALTINNLTFSSTGILNLTTASPSPVLVTTKLTTSRTASLITVNAANTMWDSGTVYDLVSYTTTGSSVGLADFSLGTVPNLGPRQSAALTNPIVGSTGYIALSITGDVPVWTGAYGADWTTATIPSPKNWRVPGKGTTDFLTGDTVLFDDTATGTTVVNIADYTVAPTSVTFNNSTKNYTLNSTSGYGITSGVLVKNGTGSLTINNANSYAGGTMLNNGTLILNSANAVGTGAMNVAGGTLDINITDAIAANDLNISGGVVNLNIASAITASALNLNGGTLKIVLNDATALGTGVLTFNGGSLDNASGASLATSTANLVHINGGASFPSANDLNLGVGTVTDGLTTNGTSFGGAAGQRTINVASATVTIPQITACATGVGLTKTGAGILAIIGANNDYRSSSTISGTLDIQGGKIRMLQDFRVGGLTGTGTIEAGVEDKWFYVNNAADCTFDGVISGGESKLGLNKSGAGTLTLTNTGNVIDDTVTVNAGTLNFKGSHTNTTQVDSIGSTAGNNGILNIAAGSTFGANNNPGQFTSSLIVGGNATGAGSIRLNGGTLSVGSQFGLGSGTGGYAAYTQNSGTATTGSFIVVGFTGDRSVANFKGGTTTLGSNLITVATGNSGSIGVMNMAGGTVNSLATTGYSLTIGGIFVGEFGAGTLNVTGGDLNLSGWGLRLGHNTGAVGIANLLGGTVTTPSASKGAGSGTLNFNGGTLKASGDSTNFLAVGNAYVYAGGAKIDDGGFAITIAQPLTAPAGHGVSTAGLTVSGGGFIDSPLVQITGDGTGATAVASIDSLGNLTGITVTNPGVNYTHASFSLLGGGNGNTGAISGTPTIVTNVGGGLTKSGVGTLTLTGELSYTGDTIVNQGALVIGGSGVLNTPNAGVFVASNATLSAGSITANSLNIGGGPYATAAAAMTATAVPEPSSIALLMLAGLGLVGWAIRRAHADAV